MRLLLAGVGIILEVWGVTGHEEHGVTLSEIRRTADVQFVVSKLKTEEVEPVKIAIVNVNVHVRFASQRGLSGRGHSR